MLTQHNQTITAASTGMPSKVTIIGALTVSIMILIIFGFAYGVCLYFRLTEQISSFGQAAINMAMIAVGYWLGSSAGSEKKSDTIAGMSGAQNPIAAPARRADETDTQYLARVLATLNPAPMA
jgi:hypothetical protein